ncbi:UV radiation resistance-associated protein-like [Ylistrum balloti]|uniref:UV radiation resistance-associated protein-like n=1 Tax=Ylistrum balloti TaxID=509963 RepID=UPI00290589BD|nr:UV radiation resistance-associated protein-like [Ylistrum balloti]
MSQISTKKARCLFELQTYQRRLRHLRSLAIRNLVCPSYNGKDVHKLQSYFTLHRDTAAKAFYTSEKITGSLNPSWQSFDISRYEGEINIKSQSLVVRVWLAVDDDCRLLLDWTVHLTGLDFFADKLQQDMVKYSPNTMIFGMFDKFFVAPDINKEKVKPLINLPVEAGTAKKSYTSASLERIYTVLRAIKQTQVSVSRVHSSIEDKLLSSQEKSQKLCEREATLLKVRQLRSELTWQTTCLQSDQEECEKAKHRYQTSRKQLDEKFALLEKERAHLSDRKKHNCQTRESLIKENAQLWIRRKQLTGELATNVYSITESKKSDQKSDMFICGVKLPNSEEFLSQEDMMVSVSLGYVCHMVMMMSDILDIPLRYPMTHNGSRSVIQDHIHTKLLDKDRQFPLFAKGKEKFQFNYGVFLLNKNISQLRYYCGLGTTDLRQTLSNMKSLLELRLGVRLYTPGIRKIGTGSEGKDRSVYDFDRTDTQSSLASGGRFSLPDSTDMTTLDVTSKENKNNHSPGECNNSSQRGGSGNNGTHTEKHSNEDVEDIFRPSEDHFFKISNPVSEQLDMFNDMNVIHEDFGHFEMIDENNVISRDQVTEDGCERKDVNSAILGKTNTSQLGGDNYVYSVIGKDDLTFSNQGPKKGKHVLHVDSANLRVGVGGDITLHNTENIDQLDDEPACSAGDVCDKMNIKKEVDSLETGDSTCVSNASETIIEHQRDVPPCSSTHSKDQCDTEHSKQSNLDSISGFPESGVQKSSVQTRESSSDSDSSDNFRSFKTSAFKHSNDLVVNQVDSDTKSYESLNSGSSPQEAPIEREATCS